MASQTVESDSSQPIEEEADEQGLGALEGVRPSLKIAGPSCREEEMCSEEPGDVCWAPLTRGPVPVGSDDRGPLLCEPRSLPDGLGEGGFPCNGGLEGL